MRILHLLGANEDTGGILTVLRNLQTATAGEGCEHVLWVNAAYREIRQPAMQYRYSRHLLQDLPNHLKLGLRSLRAMPELRALLRQESYDVLHAHTRGAFPIALALATIGRRTIVFTNHGYARRRGMYRWAAGRCRFHTCVLTPNMARHYGLELPAPNIRVVSECCADVLFERPLARHRPTAPDRPLRLVGLGNVVGWKNWHLILEALAHLPEPERRRLEFHHWGTVPHDDDSAAYARQIDHLLASRELARNAFFHGLSLNVEDQLRAADWFVLPSTNEPCSVALIEALALGLPALVSASGGNLDIVRDGQTGLYFEPDNVSILARCLGRIARGEAAMASPAAVRDSVRPRSATAVATEYLRLYRQLTRG